MADASRPEVPRLLGEHHEPYGDFSIDLPHFAAQFRGKSVRDPFKLGADIDAVESAIATRLPAGLSVQRPAARSRQVEQMLAAFHLNLTALSYIALLVGLFLVYNTVSVSVLSRRHEIGTLRALGVSRANVRALFLAEAAALAMVGALAGLGIGRVLADGAVALTATAVSAASSN
mgnify:CR=1 FL=1